MELLLVVAVAVLWSKWRAAVRRASAIETAFASRGPRVIEGIVMATAGGYAYWFAGGRLVRAPWVDGYADLDRLEPADPLECDDLPPALAVEVMDALEQAEVELRQGRHEHQP